MFTGGYMIYFVITIVFSVIGMGVQQRLRSKFRQYSGVPLSNGRSGAEVAEAMLQHYGIRDVRIVEGQGFLTDHYNPGTKTVSLSPGVFRGRNIAAAAVAAHECGHAVQHANAYVWLQMRSAIVPLVQVASQFQQLLLILALGVFAAASSALGQTVLLITIGAFAITTLFSLITLPVEFDASRRALAWLDSSNFARGSQYEGAKDALWWAAMTYVVQALASLAVLVFLVFRYLGSRE